MSTWLAMRGSESDRSELPGSARGADGFEHRRVDAQSELAPIPINEPLLEAMAEFAAGAGHEINNPVATILGHVQQLLAAESDPERRAALLTIGSQAYRIRDMIADAMLFARPPAPKLTPVNLGEAVRTALDSQAELIPAAVQCVVNAPTELPVAADRTQLLVVLSNLIRNAAEALSRRGTRLDVSAGLDANDSRFAIVTVCDDGPGLTEVERLHLFNPFFSGRQAGRGLGFGLPKCWRIVTQHGGRMEAAIRVTGGFEIRVWWPRNTPSPSA
jgi:signal transduction histidine kinase